MSAGNDTLSYDWQIGAIASSKTGAPFWLHANTNGDISSSPYSGNIHLGIYKANLHNERWWDYDFGVQLTGRLQSRPTGSTQPIATGYFKTERGASLGIAGYDLEDEHLLWHFDDGDANRASPIVAGDTVYGPGGKPAIQGGQCLHAAVLGFDHPVSGERIRLEAPLPQYFSDFLEKLRRDV